MKQMKVTWVARGVFWRWYDEETDSIVRAIFSGLKILNI